MGSTDPVTNRRSQDRGNLRAGRVRYHRSSDQHAKHARRLGTLPTVTVMTKDDYRAAIAAIGLTPTSAARFFRVNERLARRWASGELPIPYSVELSLRLMIQLELTALDVIATEINHGAK